MPTNILHEKGNMTELLQIEKQERTRFKVTTQHKKTTKWLTLVAIASRPGRKIWKTTFANYY